LRIETRSVVDGSVPVLRKHRNTDTQCGCATAVKCLGRGRTAVPGDYVDRMATQNLVPLLNEHHPTAITLFSFTLVSCRQSRVQKRIFSGLCVGFDPKYRPFHVIEQQFDAT
jgi:hypothetical protein